VVPVVVVVVVVVVSVVVVVDAVVVLVVQVLHMTGQLNLASSPSRLSRIHHSGLYTLPHCSGSGSPLQSGVVVVDAVVVLVVSTHELHRTGQTRRSFSNLQTLLTSNGAMSPHSSSGSGPPLQMSVVVVDETVVVVVVVVVVDIVVVVVPVSVVVVSVTDVPVYVVEDTVVVVEDLVVVVVVVVEVSVVVVSVTVVLVPVVVDAVVVVVSVTVFVVVELVQTPHFAGQLRRTLAPVTPLP